MNTKIEKTLGYVRKHKKQILIASGVVILSGIGLHQIAKNHSGSMKESSSLIANAVKDKKILPDLGIGVVDEYVKHGHGPIEMMVDKLTIDDIGKLGEAIVNNIPDDIPDNAKVWALINIKEIA